MTKRELEKLRKEKKKSEKIGKLITKYWPEELELAYCEKKQFEGIYPTDMKKKIAEFDYKKLHYVIYIKK